MTGLGACIDAIGARDVVLALSFDPTKAKAGSLRYPLEADRELAVVLKKEKKEARNKKRKETIEEQIKKLKDKKNLTDEEKQKIKELEAEKKKVEEEEKQRKKEEKEEKKRLEDEEDKKREETLEEQIQRLKDKPNLTPKEIQQLQELEAEKKRLEEKKEKKEDEHYIIPKKTATVDFTKIVTKEGKEAADREPSSSVKVLYDYYKDMWHFHQNIPDDVVRKDGVKTTEKLRERDLCSQFAINAVSGYFGDKFVTDT